MPVVAEVTNKVVAFIQARINAFHTTKPWTYVSTTPNGVDVTRIGIGVYADNDAQIENIDKVLTQLAEEGKAGKPNPMIVNVDGTEFVIVAAKLSTDPKNLSKRPKILLADHMLGSNAEVDADTRKNSLSLLLQMRESNKSLKSQPAIVKAQKELASISADEFDALLS